MADKEFHPVVTLLLKRIESHPEEFGRGAHRWDWIIERVQNYGSKEEDEAIDAALRPIRLQEVHEDMMDELCNGDDRRRKEEEEREYEKQLMQQVQQQRMAQQQGLTAAQNAYTGSFGKPSSQPLVIAAPNGTEAMRITTNGDLQIGSETLNEGIIKKIKGALKI
jgi:hypothetical protein